MPRFQKPIVIALGGNAISPVGQEGNIPQQFANTRETVLHLAKLIERGAQMLISHGNGPQVGNVLRRVELAAHEVYTLPLDICGADTQGGMGYMIGQCLNNEMRRRGIERTACTIITTVIVDRDDPEFHKPSKPIGRFYEREQAMEMQKRYGWQMAEARRNGKFRRVVPSPLPKAIVESKLIRECVAAGDLVIAGGGGGIPVAPDENGDLAGVEAVIDKDRTSALLACEVGAATFVIATGVKKVALNFGTPEQTEIDRMTVSEARRHWADGQFPPGSMGPKIEAAIEFLDKTSDSAAAAIICDLEHVAEAIDGRSGTWIQQD